MCVDKGFCRLLAICLALNLLLVLSLAETAFSQILINEFVASNTLGILDGDEEYEDWIEIRNIGPVAVSLAGHRLSDDPAEPMKWTFPGRTLEPGGHLLVFASGKDRHGSELHCNFRLDPEGNAIILSDAGGALLDAVATGVLPCDISRGRGLGSGPELFFFTNPSPGEANLSYPYTGFSEAPAFSAPGGFQSTPLILSLDTSLADADIYYSLDGSDPGPGSLLYEEPLIIDANTVLRAISYLPGLIPEIASASYFFGIFDPNLPVLSIITDPPNLWDIDFGIYVLGDDYDPDRPYYGANFWEDWERPAHIEFYEPDGSQAFAQDIGIKIHGGWSRAKEQKSLRLIARDGYGHSRMEHQIFESKDIDEFKYLLLRNSGNDWCRTHFRDGMMQNSTLGWNQDRQAFRPAVLYLNGEYWGIQNIRERIDEHYLESNHDVDSENVDLMGSYHDVIEGDNLHYLALVSYINQNGLADDEHFQYIETQMEVDQFAAYNIFEIYYGNTDWPGINSRKWRPRTADGRWRWLIFDLDFGLGLYIDHTHNTLAWALDPNSSDSTNPPWATFLLRKLMENDGFRQTFINRYADMLNTVFTPISLHALKANTISLLSDEIPEHLARWEFNLSYWNSQVADLESYIDARPAVARSHLRQQFGLGNERTLSLDLIPPGGGTLDLTAISIDSAWSGLYFEGNPVRVTARPAPGYSFAGWSGGGPHSGPEIEINLVADYSLTALFTCDLPFAVINEINYNSATEFDVGDWVEIFNPTQWDLDIGGWQFRDDNDQHRFMIPAGSTLGAHDYLVLARNLDALQLRFPELSNAIGDFDFGLSGGGELIRLFDADSVLVDQVHYDDVEPWPPEADGAGPTLELIDPLQDNAHPVNWRASMDHGTPGSPNSILVAVAENPPFIADLGLSAHPNPFNPRSVVTFTLGKMEHVELHLYDIGGRRLRTLVDGRFEAGRHELILDGRSEAGAPLPSGIYLLRLAAGTEKRNLKLVLLR